MRRSLRLFVRCAVFLAVLVPILYGINYALFNKQTYSDYWGETSKIYGFYEMERDSIDVLFLGSSFPMSAFSPQEIYNETGIRSYNLGTQQQNLAVSYYWLKEALRFQSPKAVVLDTFLCFPYDVKAPLNSSEGAIHIALDAMKTSPVKIEAVRDIRSYMPELDPLEFFFLNIRYHNRWSSLREQDFTAQSSAEFKGYTVVYDTISLMSLEPFSPADSDESMAMAPNMEEYLTRIVDLCREKGIALILCRVPCVSTVSQYNTIARYAQEHQVPYYDFNEQSLFSEIGYVPEVDAAGHLNISGAVKVSRKMAHILQDDFGIAPVQDAQYESTREIYAHATERQAIAEQTDLLQYLELLHDENYSVFFAVNGDASIALTPEIVQAMQSFGLAFPLEGQFGTSYCAAVTPDGTFEKAGLATMVVNGSFRNGRTLYTVSSDGWGNSGSACSICIDFAEYCRNKTGLNIVVYDNLLKKVIDSVCFDLSVPTGPEGIPCTRE